ncbi:MAG: hypothetical protein KGH55_01640 [Nanoarchaeota archaeon]|nr:hypothetical protein [Nanoarchaeota archaeon]
MSKDTYNQKKSRVVEMWFEEGFTNLASIIFKTENPERFIKESKGVKYFEYGALRYEFRGRTLQ